MKMMFGAVSKATKVTTHPNSKKIPLSIPKIDNFFENLCLRHYFLFLHWFVGQTSWKGLTHEVVLVKRLLLYFVKVQNVLHGF